MWDGRTDGRTTQKQYTSPTMVGGGIMSIKIWIQLEYIKEPIGKKLSNVTLGRYILDMLLCLSPLYIGFKCKTEYLF